jgi:hypothetical protein
MIPSPLTAQEKSTSMKPFEIGTRLELFVDDLLVERMTGVAFRLHAPVRQAPAKSPLPKNGVFGTIIKDGDLYRAYYRSDIPGYDKGRYGERNADNEPNEITCYAAARFFMEQQNPPDAIMAATDFMAIGALNYLNEQQISVPETVAVLGFNNLARSAETNPPLTTIELPLEQLATRAIEALIHQIENDKSIIQQVFECKLIKRQSS